MTVCSNLHFPAKAILITCYIVLFFQTTLREMMGITRKSNAIPCDENFTLYSSFPAFKRIMDMEGKMCLEM